MSLVYEHKDIVRWSETDAAGIYYFAHALVWAQDAEHALCRLIDQDWRPHGWPRRAVSATYHAPLRAGDSYAVQLNVEKLGNSSITFGWAILKGETNCAEGQHTIIHLGDEGRPAPLPATLRARLELYLKGAGDE